MNPDRWERIKVLFSAAAELPAAERAAFLDRETGADADLAREVLELLAANDSTGDFPGSIPEGLRAAALAVQDDVRPGERVGAYRLIERIGSGGMGDVYRAVRDDDQYRADVAIKLMRADFSGPLAEQRFRNERQILAALDHRNIARLLDGGTTMRGLPYVVMELVAGETIDRYCESRALDARERVKLFLQVCAAVSYAHQHLVVHRDLKPGNVLVTADGSVKLLDFGVAKLLESDPVTGAGTENTRTILRHMTLEYASPEQVGGGAVTTVSDVYSLGVMLYRLVTGRSPYRSQGSDAARMAEILGDAVPTRPSALGLSSSRPIDADLDHVLLMALRKEPASRYASVEQFASDLRNYLEGLPVAARRGTAGYRLAKTLRRYRVPIAAAVLVILSMAVGLGFSIREARIAGQERATAQRHFDNLRAMSNELLSDVYRHINDLPGAATARANLVQISRRYLDQLATEASDNIELQVDLGDAYGMLADVQGGQAGRGGGDTASAGESYLKAIELLRRARAADPGHQRAAVELGKVLLAHARLLDVTTGPQSALAPAQEAVAILEATDGSYPADDLDRLINRWSAYDSLGNTLANLQRFDESAVARARMVEIVEAYLQEHPDEVQALKLLRNSYNNAALDIDGRLSAVESAERALGLLQKSMAVTEKLLAADPQSPEHQATLAIQRMNLGDTLYYAGRYRESIAMYHLALPQLTKSAEDKADARAQLQLAATECGLAGALLKLGDLPAATAQLDKVEPVLRRLLQGSPQNITLRFAVSFVEMARGQVLEQRARHPSLQSGARFELLRQARKLLQSGVNRMRQVNETYVLAGGEKGIWDDGIAALARVETALSAAGM